MIQLQADQCVRSFLQEATRLGVEVHWEKDMINLKAAYVARPGKPGKILLFDSMPRPGSAKLCTLLAHEMVHVMQHWKGNLRATPPLGWPIDDVTETRNLTRQQREAYSAEKDPAMVLNKLRALQPIED